MISESDYHDARRKSFVDGLIIGGILSTLAWIGWNACRIQGWDWW